MFLPVPTRRYGTEASAPWRSQNLRGSRQQSGAAAAQRAGIDVMGWLSFRMRAH